ncbi:acyl-CoA thioesterase [Kingella oralis]|jgi:hypothetical protein|uniref:acyl-CoA thioesterase n=1 Tax=Kingella oralis TaxID=505 RepID=UPI0034E585EF
MPYTQEILNYHLDGYAHVNNARYLEFLEAARWHYFKQRMPLGSLQQAQLVVARMDIRYRRAAKLGDILHVHSSLVHAQSRQFVVEQRILFADSEQLCVQAEVTLMPTDRQGRVFRLPEPLLAAFQQLTSSS